MASLVSLLVAGTLLAAPAAATAENGSTEIQVQELLEQFSQSLYDEVLPKLGTMTTTDVHRQVTAAAQRQWREVVAPRQGLLQRRAEEILAALPAAEAFDETRFKSLADSNQWNDLLDRLKGKDSADAKTAMQILFWNPTAVADFVSVQLQVRTLGAQAYGKRAMLGMFAHPAWQALDRTPKRPILVRRLGPELFVVELQRNEEGCYIPVRVRWLTRQTVAD